MTWKCSHIKSNILYIAKERHFDFKFDHILKYSHFEIEKLFVLLGF